MITRRQTLLGMGAAAVAMPLKAAFASEPQRLFFYELYNKGTTTLSEKALALQGTPVEIVGFMAPPLKAESPFFVLTDIPMETCPFCDEIAFWPDNIIYVTSQQELPSVPFDRQIRVAGTLDLGEATDPETGFVSLVRLKDAGVTRT
jgi:hypothetical protein